MDTVSSVSKQLSDYSQIDKKVSPSLIVVLNRDRRVQSIHCKLGTQACLYVNSVLSFVFQRYLSTQNTMIP
jgi:hypothetical protein